MAVEVAVEPETVPALLAVGLVSFEVVNRRRDRVARLLVGTDRDALVAHHREGLERDHHFVVLDIIADDEEQVFHGGVCCAGAWGSRD